MTNPVYAIATADGEAPVAITAGCTSVSWSPEVISLYGDSETVLAKLSKFNLELDSRRVFILTVEAGGDAEISFYEKTSPHKLTVKKWRGTSNGNLSAELDSTIIENKGVHCIGEQSKAVLDSFPNVTENTDVPIPVNAKAAFSHAIRAFGNNYLKVTV